VHIPGTSADFALRLAPDEARNRTVMIAGWILGIFLAIWFFAFPMASR
jgi:hypothetical protein